MVVKFAKFLATVMAFLILENYFLNLGPFQQWVDDLGTLRSLTNSHCPAKSLVRASGLFSRRGSLAWPVT